MQNRAIGKLTGPLLVQPDQVRKLYLLVEEIRKSSSRADAYFSVGYRPATVFLADEQQYTVDTIDDIFLIENRTANPILKIRFAWPFDSERSVSATLSSEWFRGHAAEIEVTGSTQQNLITISEFTKILDVDPDLFIKAIRTPAWVLSLLVVFVFYLFTGSITVKNFEVILRVYHKDAFLLIMYSMLFWIIPVIVVSAIINWLVSRYLGRAIYYWGGGVQRYHNRRLMLIFVFWTIPLAAITKILIG